MSKAHLILAGYQVASSLAQADLIDKQNDLNTYIREQNAEFLEIDKRNQELDDQEAINRYQTQIQAVEASQKAAFAARGVDTGFGTAREIVQESKINALLNTIDLQANARAKSMGMKNQLSNYRLQTGMQEMQGNLQAQSTRNAALIRGAGYAIAGYKTGSDTLDDSSDFGGSGTCPQAV